MDVQKSEDSYDATLQQINRALLMIDPTPKMHLWINALEARVTDSKSAYFRGCVVLTSLESVKEILSDLHLGTASWVMVQSLRIYFYIGNSICCTCATKL